MISPTPVLVCLIAPKVVNLSATVLVSFYRLPQQHQEKDSSSSTKQHQSFVPPLLSSQQIE